MSLVLTITDALRGLLEPATALFDPSRRVFAPFLLASWALAVGFGMARGVSARATLREVFSPAVWWHRSSRLDLQLLAAKGLLRGLTRGLGALSSVLVGALVASWLRRHAGEVPSGAVSAAAAGAIFTVAAFVADDLTRFAVHRAMHRVGWLWEFHKVHHSAEVLTPFSLYRTHPVEAALNGLRESLTVGLVLGASVWAFGASLRAWQVLGIDALGFAWSLAGANLRHSHVWLSWGPRVERWLLSPAQHQVHHSVDARHQDVNFGTALAVWDRLTGSLYTTTATPEPLRFGLADDAPALTRNVLTLLTHPFTAAARRLAGALHPMHTRPLRAAGLLALAAVSSSCTSPAPVDRGAVLAGLGRCVVDTTREFTTAADALVTATTAFAQAPSDATRDGARAAWVGAMDVWQRAELMQAGPAAVATYPGGRGLRDRIYAWPDVSRCLVEQALASRAWERGLDGLGANAKGLAAMEYLLFYTGTANACAATEAPNSDGAWAAITPQDMVARRAAYARAIAVDVAAQSRALTAAWEPTGFLAQLTTAGRGSTLFTTQQRAVSALAEAVMHVDTDVKDLRLARPLGVRDCTTGTCPAFAESQWADRGVRHLRANLAGARTMLLGCAAGGNQGFDDLLDGAGASVLSARMRTSLDAADAALRAVPGEGMIAALARDRAAVQRAYDAVRELSGFLKTELTMTLQITSTRAEGDND